MIDDMWCHNDAMLFDIGKTKTDQEGTKNVDHPWHVYSNPEDPYICPFVAMGCHLMSNPNILAGKCALFEGSGQYDRFNKIFLDIVSDTKYRKKFVSLGMPPEHFGTHSIRKGAVTHIATGSTSCPPIASICLRANWAMPGVMNRYIKFENAGDQFVGRCVSGLSRLKNSFLLVRHTLISDLAAELIRNRMMKSLIIGLGTGCPKLPNPMRKCLLYSRHVLRLLNTIEACLKRAFTAKATSEHPSSCWKRHLLLNM